MTHGGTRDGAGRKPGSRNRKSADVSAQVQEHAALILAQLVDLAKNARSETMRVAAMRELLTRGYGKAVAPEPDEEIPEPKDRVIWEPPNFSTDRREGIKPQDDL
jgi:hypothetical protein